ncbi:MAG: TMEM165/GDT1 family protein [Desulfobaccales bacterium]
MEGFFLPLGLVFIAELGDKTQLVALTLATRFRAGVVLPGVLVATLVVHLLSVAIGGLSGNFLSTAWIELLSGLAFIGFALWTIRGDQLDGGEKVSRIRSPFLIVTITFFLAELGDKTMLSTVTLAASYPLALVWIGSSLGMVLSDALAIWVGRVLGKQLPEKAIKIGAAGIFFVFGLYYIIQGFAGSVGALPILKTLSGI